jgi:hypothetical protein
VLYMHLRIFAYTSNALIASFEYMELILVQKSRSHRPPQFLTTPEHKIGQKKGKNLSFRSHGSISTNVCV